MPGNHLEDLRVGARFSHDGGRTVTETDVIWFSLLTMNQHPVHLDAHSEEARGHDTLLVPATLVVSIVLGLSVFDVSRNATANLSWHAVDFLGPVHAGDSLRASTEIVDVAADEGLVTCETTGFNQTGTPVVRIQRRIEVSPKDAGA